MNEQPVGHQRAGTDGSAESAVWADDTTFRRHYPLLWWLTLAGPLLLTAGILLGVWYGTGWKEVTLLVMTALITFFLLGKFVILGGQVGQMYDARDLYSAEQLYALVLYMDVVTVSLLTFHSGFLFRLPMLGDKLRTLVTNSYLILQANPWMRRATFFGLVVFVMFPLASTGSIGGAIFGKLLGLGRLRTFVGVTLGNALGGGVVYYAGGWVTRHVDHDDPVLLLAAIVIVAGIVYLLNRRYRRMLQASRPVAAD